jgi:hypothetical protein
MRTRALVIFSGQTDFWWQRFLRSGYRHCGVVVECGQHWLVVEPLATHLRLQLLPFSSADLPSALRRRGLEVIETFVCPPPKPALYPGLFSCVAMVKRALGLQALTVQTPWQLRKIISPIRKKNLEKELK